MPFEKFTETARSYRAKISLRSNGTIGLNAGAVKKFRIGANTFSVLFYDRERKLIGIRPSKNGSEEGAQKLNLGKTGAWIAARRFLDYYELSTEETKRYDASWDEQEQMIVAKIS
ncbi:MAG: hypothetical protein L0387_44810 [Acidobacteria bacterium]|nr:hypothetical protein [Acidobacteriota bacterium]